MTQPPPRPTPPTGAAPGRRRARWERYRITHPFSARAQLGLWGAIAGTVALAALLGRALDMKGGVVIVVALPFIVSWFENQRTAFQFDAGGLRIGALSLPWDAVDRIVVVNPPHEQDAVIGVRPFPGAPLPPGAAPQPRHPAVSAPFHVVVPRHKLDLAKMTAKARRYAPEHVRIVVADASGERPVTPAA
ncbi:hypothetical protein ABZ135_25330 [Streptomyces sp. NPDC006339]|uniref:hypothetical protein n=1 Tax=Streptomyces sp. NPDC006339 TaxID=3156755 RepID=UPI0033B3A99C